MENNKVNRFEH